MTNVNEFGYVTNPELLAYPVEHQPTLITWHYPEVSQKRAPRAFKCSDCEAHIERGSFYWKHGHGRYCHSCSTKYVGK